MNDNFIANILLFFFFIIVISSQCNGVTDCFSYPQYPCCSGCNVVEEDAQGKWGIENNQWCGLQAKCNGKYFI